MMRIGLVSVTYRKLSPEEVVSLSREAGVECLEWGGDVHVPPGDLARARQVASLTHDAGLSVAAYGSYYRLAVSEADGLPFEKVLESAVALGAPVIRVWAGNKASSEADESYRQRVAADALRIAGLAHAAHIKIAYEYHGGTLTDETASARALLDATVHPAVTTLWQPYNGESLETCLTSLHSVIDRLSNVHVFHWWPDAGTRLPLAEGAERWQQYLTVLRQAGKNPDLLLEFVPKDDPAVLAREVATLRRWLA
ncbi:MAG: xylose isomerase [Verrucomicrobia bacterium Tous-C9LFEB]|nr:MAG: xylose isomerase [Verrucomicrobia bacterium Tous-C9LFEB]